MSEAAFASGAMDKKYKELIAMVIGVVAGCNGCIASHARGAAHAAHPNRRPLKLSASAFSCMVVPPPSTVLAPTPHSANSPMRLPATRSRSPGRGTSDQPYRHLPIINRKTTVMSVKNVTATDFESTIVDNAIVMVDFWLLGVARAGLLRRFLNAPHSNTLTSCLPR